MRDYGDPPPPGYSRVRATIEPIVKRVFFRDWPARLYGLQCRRPGFLRVERHTVRMRSLRPQASVRIAFLTDFHFGATVPAWFLESAAARAVGLRPDLILTGGDTLMFDAGAAAKARRALASLEAPLGVYGVLGNHDIWVSRSLSEALHREAGVELLVNRGLTLETPAGPLYLCGVDDAWAGFPNAKSALWDRPAGVPSLMVSHSPLALLDDPAHAPDLCLCGHTHGGQWCRADGSAYWIPHRRRLDLASGWGRVGRTRVYVSRGIGGAEIPIRIHCPPEVTLLELKGATA